MSQKTVLLVDDSAVIRRQVRNALAPLAPFGVTVIVAANGRAACELVAKQHVDLVIVDVEMPIMGGLEFIEVFRRDPVHRTTPVVVISAQTHADLTAVAQALSVRVWLEKSFHRQTLARLVVALLELNIEVMVAEHAQAPSPFWTAVEQNIANDLAMTFGDSQECLPMDTACTWAVGAEVAVTFLESELSCRIQVLVEEDSAIRAAQHILGDGPWEKAALTDMVRELANMAGGAFVDATATRGARASLGLPTSSEGETLETESKERMSAFFCVLPELGFRIGLRMLARRSAANGVSAAELREGMLLGEDVRDACGTLIARGGTRLTNFSAGQIALASRPQAQPITVHH